MPIWDAKILDDLEKDIQQGMQELKNDLNDLTPPHISWFKKTKESVVELLANNRLNPPTKITHYDKDLLKALNKFIHTMDKLIRSSKNQYIFVRLYYRDVLKAVHKGVHDKSTHEIIKLTHMYSEYTSNTCILFKEHRSPVSELKQLTAVLENIARRENKNTVSVEPSYSHYRHGLDIDAFG